MRHEYYILPENRANSIYCRDHVGLISEAHQAMLQKKPRYKPWQNPT
ncbi:hypothetical protein EcE24377A_0552 [Escherichia coli O139:H28 str. E24377A]|uniref:Uncharacterized protein n=2 Tax=Escherichia coli TaxID=562 RepID=A7ZIS2_ECO24|nr:hypothetical protein EcE24377A_0552 [Escherichia coli O139:H28 str. E24377A]EFK70925.1 hypothetical protein HMPREF9347_00226 [Escherichia coli MS 124-1]EFU36310.1 hypothetical protein HMPREF9350_01981 [Escherichia coli MS 85-1]ESD70599.1 hypothetical protein HMPREF1610_02064 [Escherichia coli 908555]